MPSIQTIAIASTVTSFVSGYGLGDLNTFSGLAHHRRGRSTSVAAPAPFGSTSMAGITGSASISTATPQSAHERNKALVIAHSLTGAGAFALLGSLLSKNKGLPGVKTYKQTVDEASQAWDEWTDESASVPGSPISKPASVFTEALQAEIDSFGAKSQSLMQQIINEENPVKQDRLFKLLELQPDTWAPPTDSQRVTDASPPGSSNGNGHEHHHPEGEGPQQHDPSNAPSASQASASPTLTTSRSQSTATTMSPATQTSFFTQKVTVTAAPPIPSTSVVIITATPSSTTHEAATTSSQSSTQSGISCDVEWHFEYRTFAIYGKGTLDEERLHEGLSSCGTVDRWSVKEVSENHEPGYTWVVGGDLPFGSGQCLGNVMKDAGKAGGDGSGYCS